MVENGTYRQSALIHPVLLCGGGGVRLWPLSTADRPKPFLEYRGSSLFAQALARVSNRERYAAPIIVCGEGQHFLVREALRQAGMADATLLCEPEGRDTAASIALAVLEAFGETEPLLILPTDQWVDDVAAWQEAILRAQQGLKDYAMLLLGIRPTHAATGYGYIETESSGKSAVPVRRFHEKPSAALAARYVERGDLWNGGTFLALPSTLAGAFASHAPELWLAASRCHAASISDGMGRYYPPARMQSVPRQSFDVAVVEHMEQLGMVAFDGDWSDLGTYDAMHDALPQDEQGNAIEGAALCLDSRNNTVQSDLKLLVTAGVENLVITVHRGMALVATRGEAARLKDWASHLPSEKEITADCNSFRPEFVVLPGGLTLGNGISNSHSGAASGSFLVRGVEQVSRGQTNQPDG